MRYARKIVVSMNLSEMFGANRGWPRTETISASTKLSSISNLWYKWGHPTQPSVCQLVFVVLAHAARRAMAAAEPLPKQRWRAFTGISLSRPRPALPILVGPPDLLRPSPPEKETKGKDKGKKDSVRPAPGLTAPPSQPPPARTRTPLPPLSRFPSSRRAPRRRASRCRRRRCAPYSTR